MIIVIKAAQIVRGGGLTHLNKIIEWLGKLAPTDEFVVLGKKGQEGLFIAPPENFRYKFYRLPGLNLPAQIFWERHLMPRLLYELKADLLFEPGNRGTLKSPCPKISLIHNIAPFDDVYFNQETHYQKLRLSLLRQATLESMKASQGIVFISEYSRKLFSRIININSVKSRVVYHGRIEADEIKNDTAARIRLGIPDHYLLSVSDVWRYKKTFEMVKGYLLALKSDPSLPVLVVAGANYSPAYFDQIKQLIRESMQADRIIFTGQISHGAVLALYKNCRAFLFPSVVEACPNILIEALAAGCAIASSNSGVMPEIAGDAALYFDPDNQHDFATKIIAISNDPNLNASMRKRARARAQAFSWEQTARQTVSFFYDVIGDNQPSGRESLPQALEAS